MTRSGAGRCPALTCRGQLQRGRGVVLGDLAVVQLLRQVPGPRHVALDRGHLGRRRARPPGRPAAGRPRGPARPSPPRPAPPPSRSTGAAGQPPGRPVPPGRPARRQAPPEHRPGRHRAGQRDQEGQQRRAADRHPARRPARPTGSSPACPRGRRRATGPGAPRRPPTSPPPRPASTGSSSSSRWPMAQHGEDDRLGPPASAAHAYQATLTSQDSSGTNSATPNASPQPNDPRRLRPVSATTSSAGPEPPPAATRPPAGTRRTRPGRPPADQQQRPARARTRRTPRRARSSVPAAGAAWGITLGSLTGRSRGVTRVDSALMATFTVEIGQAAVGFA